MQLAEVNQTYTQDLIFTCEEKGTPIDILFSKLKVIFLKVRGNCNCAF